MCTGYMKSVGSLFVLLIPHQLFIVLMHLTAFFWTIITFYDVWKRLKKIYNSIDDINLQIMHGYIFFLAMANGYWLNCSVWSFHEAYKKHLIMSKENAFSYQTHTINKAEDSVSTSPTYQFIWTDSPTFIFIWMTKSMYFSVNFGKG